MTKKDYELIANSIKTLVQNAYETRQFNDTQFNIGYSVNRTQERQQFETLTQLVGSLCYSLKVDNKNFDEHKFQVACGFTEKIALD